MKAFSYATLLIFLILGACNKKHTTAVGFDTSVTARTNKKELIDLSHFHSKETIYWETAKEFK